MIKHNEDMHLLVQAARDFARNELLERDRAWDRAFFSARRALRSSRPARQTTHQRPKSSAAFVATPTRSCFVP